MGEKRTRQAEIHYSSKRPITETLRRLGIGRSIAVYGRNPRLSFPCRLQQPYLYSGGILIRTVGRMIPWR
jgi:hypothetical protein